MKKKRFEYHKSIFVKHLQKKINGIDKRMRYINHKYTDYQKAYKYMSGSVIVLSSTLTLFEALKNILNDDDFNEFLKTIFGIAPLIISTLVSLLATLIKFQKYQEHMEALSITEEKGIIAVSKLKRVREMIYFSKSSERLEEIRKTYLDETYQFYNEVNVKIEIELDEEDYVKYYKKMSNTDVKIGNVLIKKIDSVKDIIRKHDTIHKIIEENKQNNINKPKWRNVNENTIEDKTNNMKHSESSDDDIIVPTIPTIPTIPKKSGITCGSRP